MAHKGTVLLVGGAGYIGGHTALALADAGYKVDVLDSLASSGEPAWNHLERHLPGAGLYKGDARDRQHVAHTLEMSKPDVVVHFAALKSSPESTRQPLAYHRHNMDALLTVLEAMDDQGPRRMVFSSSAAVYGDQPSPITETAQLNPSTPYGATKAIGERVLADLCSADTRWSATALRYFNPVGADPMLRHGEWVRTAGNVAPIIAQAALQGSAFSITGTDFDTPDGTGLRDYIHVADLAMAHVAAVEVALEGFQAINIGTGQPVSVLELVQAFDRASNRTIPYVAHPRRPGDVAACWADTNKVQQVLGWHPTHSVQDMARDHWNWATR